MKIEYNNWSPASEIFDLMVNFDKNINAIKTSLDESLSFVSNIRNEEVSQNDINERLNQLIRTGAKVDATIGLLKDLLDSYHAYQEMYFDMMESDEPKVELEKEAVSFCFDNGINLSPRQAKNIARHFFELGKNARKKEL